MVDMTLGHMNLMAHTKSGDVAAYTKKIVNTRKGKDILH